MNIQYLERSGRPRLAYVYTRGTNKQLPPVVFLGGYRSDMSGTKATYLEQQCKSRGQTFLRFDYSGHGASEGKFSDGTIGAWKQDAQDIINHVIKEPAILVGSSMGGWMALLFAIARPDLVKGLIGIAAAPDFTEEIYSHLTTAQKIELEKTGRVSVPNDYSDEPYHFTKAFYQEAKHHMVLDTPRTFDFPVRLIQGKQDKDVPWHTALKIQKNFTSPDFDILLIEDGDHRLSRPEDLETIGRMLCSI
jgi:pimeloyl-ACP methyl ester carboxylesterase